MGAALADNLFRCGISVHAWDANHATLSRLKDRLEDAVKTPLANNGPQLRLAQTLDDLINQLPGRRIILLMVNAGAVLDELLDQLLPQLETGDTVVDCGNSHFADTQRRSQRLAQQGLEFVGLGVSGGPQGARLGPSMMFGGSDNAWQQLKPILQRLAAASNRGPCVARLGSDGAGHFCKMVHNGIEYGDMQLLAEAYQLLRDGYGLNAGEIGECFQRWQQGPLASYLTELSARVLNSRDVASGEYWVNLIADQAGQKGTGRWTVVEALTLGVPVPTIATAVDARALSSQPRAQQDVNNNTQANPKSAQLPLTELMPILGRALLLARLCAYDQGFQLVAAGNSQYGWDIEPTRLAKIWTQGCIIRSALLDTVIAALDSRAKDRSDRPLHQEPALAVLVQDNQGALSQVVALGSSCHVPTPALSASLNWLLALQSSRSAQNLVQAQRDAFGQHGFTRVDDATGTQHHGTWVD